MGLAHNENMDNIGTNDVTTTSQRMIGTTSYAGTNHKHLEISEE